MSSGHTWWYFAFHTPLEVNYFLTRFPFKAASEIPKSPKDLSWFLLFLLMQKQTLNIPEQSNSYFLWKILVVLLSKSPFMIFEIVCYVFSTIKLVAAPYIQGSKIWGVPKNQKKNLI